MEINGVTKYISSTDFCSEIKLLQLAEKVVDRYVYSGTIPSREREDVMMSMVENFLNKQDRIVSGFSGKAKITTYCIAVLNRMCCEVIRKQLMHWKSRPEEYIKEDHSSVLSSSEHLVIEDEVHFLDKILRMFNKDRVKILIFMAYFFELEPKTELIKQYGKNSNEKEDVLFKKLNPEDIQNKSHLFENLAEINNLCEHKSVKADAVRMWLNKTINKVIERLNGPYHRANYDKENLRTLFEHYYLSNSFSF